MRRILLAILVALFALALAGAALADEQETVEKNIALAMTLTGDEAAINDYVHAMMLVNSLRALGGEIELDGDQLRIRLDLDAEQLDALRKALAECRGGKGMAGAFMPGMKHRGDVVALAPDREKLADEYRKIVIMRKDDGEDAECGSHERFLLGKKSRPQCEGCEPPCECKEKETEVIVRGDMREGGPFTMKGECCKLVVTCPHCGKPVEVDVPMPRKSEMQMPQGEHFEKFMQRMHPDGESFECPMPDMPMPPEEHFEKFLFRMHPDGEFAPPHPPMPDMDAMKKRMGPMMEQMPEMMERMERLGNLERRLGEMERALDEFHRNFGPRFEERDREVWRAIDELHRLYEDFNREVFSELEELERGRNEEFDELWFALDELWAELEELEDEVE